MHVKLEVLAPHGVEGVAVDGFGTEVGAVDGHAQNVHLDAGAARTVTWTNVLTRKNLKERRRWFMSDNNHTVKDILSVNVIKSRQA